MKRHHRARSALFVAVLVVSSACGGATRLAAVGPRSPGVVDVGAPHGLVPVTRGDIPGRDFAAPDATEQAALDARVAQDVAALQGLHVVQTGAGVTACDEAACVYACDEACVDVDPRDQPNRSDELLVLAEQAKAAAAADGLNDPSGISGTDWANSAQVEEDLSALRSLLVLEVGGFQRTTMEDAECANRYSDCIPEGDAEQAQALHLLVTSAQASPAITGISGEP